ncbi:MULTISPECIES: hypothetical protein [unclassified Mesorhizobium]|uniref:hypothetical protein n=1 Tax=unclassified Mesorhizobium TaxID=325217 RepID=UPI0024158171|nr:MULTISPECIES: hypothetical protein [unclassified Mesorhizobium]MDG4902926.1 hypothetical protein [Mesorhizobium sp. WSM4962]MDG4906318.1 hypothetical protein [Mesorhizobium sp. WSM4898]MDG4920255.1 hypothetical protein [Mesorhizobium sp. WSM4989]
MSNEESQVKCAPLKNPRHQAYVDGLPAYKAYLEAGYKCSVRAAAQSWSPPARAKREWTQLFNLINQYIFKCFTVLCELAVMSPEGRGKNRHKLHGVKLMRPSLMRDRRRVAERLQSVGYEMRCLR